MLYVAWALIILTGAIAIALVISPLYVEMQRGRLDAEHRRWLEERRRSGA